MLLNAENIQKMNGYQLIELFKNPNNNFSVDDIKFIVQNASGKIENASKNDIFLLYTGTISENEYSSSVMEQISSDDSLKNKGFKNVYQTNLGMLLDSQARKAQTLEELMTVIKNTSAQAEAGKSQPELTKIVMELETNPNL